MHHHYVMKVIAKAYLRNHDCSVEEKIYHVLPELKLRTIFLAVYLVNSNNLEERVQVLLPGKKLSKVPVDSPNILIFIVILEARVEPSAMKNTVF